MSRPTLILAVACAGLPALALAAPGTTASVVINGGRPSSLPTQIPTTIEGISGEQVERYRIDRQWSASLGIDNLNNAKYWAYHPYTQRTMLAELRFDR